MDANPKRIKKMRFAKDPDTCGRGLSLAIFLKNKSGVDEITVEKQPYLNTSPEFFPSFDASNFHKLVNLSS